VNSSVTPTPIVVGHSYDELFDVDLGTWAARLTSFDKGPFLSYELSMPSQQGSRRNNGIEISQGFRSDLFRQGSEGSTLGIGEQNALPPN
jgi:hypothetical protein